MNKVNNIDCYQLSTIASTVSPLPLIRAGQRADLPPPPTGPSRDRTLDRTGKEQKDPFSPHFSLRSGPHQLTPDSVNLSLVLFLPSARGVEALSSSSGLPE
ncbi:uncharacterized protein LDX57_012492 [Aspergillus melleus]|uniref:uncharacterized protein n=1 Tax=Aspergillus melleus TaxID=138277 RepID=UPI001E8DD9C9|nr:uncharacterized protein LDX57_012492 [Aspergillus melleus]KAH8434861.1 hypothetical protein LDX57_012492 [Aspergillus melleus]